MSRTNLAPPYRSSSSVGRLSLYGTTIGCLAAAVITLFNLWVVSTFSSHAFLSADRLAPTVAKTCAYEPSPRAAVSTAAAFLSSFSSAWLFIVATLHSRQAVRPPRDCARDVGRLLRAAGRLSASAVRGAAHAPCRCDVDAAARALRIGGGSEGLVLLRGQRVVGHEPHVCDGGAGHSGGGATRPCAGAAGGRSASRKGGDVRGVALMGDDGGGRGGIRSAKGVQTTFDASFCVMAMGILVLVFGNDREAGKAAEGAACEEEEKEAEEASLVMGVVRTGGGRGRGKGDIEGICSVR